MSSRELQDERTHIGLDVDSAIHVHIKQAAAAHGQSLAQYVLEAVNIRLRLEKEELVAAEVLLAADPVLAELWDNPKDAEYDRI